MLLASDSTQACCTLLYKSLRSLCLQAADLHLPARPGLPLQFFDQSGTLSVAIPFIEGGWGGGNCHYMPHAFFA